MLSTVFLLLLIPSSTSAHYDGDPDLTQDLKDLLLESMSNTILLTSTVTSLTDKINKLQDDIYSFKSDLDDVKRQLVEANRDGRSRTSGSVMVVNGEEGNGDPRCARVCAGTTGRSTTNWANVGPPGIVLRDIDISPCGFVKIPTITTSVEGKSEQWRVTGTSTVYTSTTTTFTMWVGANWSGTNRDRALLYNWNVEWVAVGFTC